MVIQNTGQAWGTRNVERCTRIRLQHFDLQFNAVFVIGLAHLALNQNVVVFIQQRKMIVFTGDQRERLTQEILREFELKYFQAFATPGKTVHAKQWRRNRIDSVWFEPTSNKVADHRKTVRLDGYIEG
ncbi:hypothetical protein D3C87_1583480 [compost metagenome]